jgi:16S rRNA (cytosine967-C5)-methyltransferase
MRVLITSPPDKSCISDAVNKPSQQADTARALAVDALGMLLRRGQTLDQAFNDDPRRRALAPRDAAFARLMLLTTLRHLGEIDGALAACLDKPLPARRAFVMDVLRLGACQLLYLSTPPHAAVSAMVALVKTGRFASFKGLVNAVLRRIAREGKAILPALKDAGNTPEWLWQEWCDAYSVEAAREIAKAHLAEPPLDLTVKNNPAEWAARLGAQALPNGTLRLKHQGAVR